MALSEYKSDNKWYFESVADKKYIFNTCFLVDSIKPSPCPSERGGNVNGSFALFGEIVQKGFV